MNQKHFACWIAGGLMLAGLSGCEQPQAQRQKPGALPGATVTNAKPGAAPRLSSATYFAHGHLLERQGAFERAVEQYEKALALQPDSVIVRNRLGITFNKLARHAEATMMFREALTHSTNATYLQNNLGFSLFLEGNYAEAETVLARAIASKPDFARARMNHALALGKLGRFDEAFDDLAKVCGQADALFNMGMILTEAGRFRDAAQYLEGALAANPKLEAARLQLNEVGRLAAEEEARVAAAARRAPSAKTASDTTLAAQTQTPTQATTATPTATAAPAPASPVTAVLEEPLPLAEAAPVTHEATNEPTNTTEIAAGDAPPTTTTELVAVDALTTTPETADVVAETSDAAPIGATDSTPTIEQTPAVATNHDAMSDAWTTETPLDTVPVRRTFTSDQVDDAARVERLAGLLSVGWDDFDPSDAGLYVSVPAAEAVLPSGPIQPINPVLLQSMLGDAIAAIRSDSPDMCELWRQVEQYLFPMSAASPAPAGELSTPTTGSD